MDLHASETRALTTSGYASKKLSREGLSSYLSFGSIHPPFTIYEDIKSLMPVIIWKLIQMDLLQIQYLIGVGMIMKTMK